MLAALDRLRWDEFWCEYPPEMPDWARSLRQILQSASCRDLELAPAEYILLGTGHEQWQVSHVTLRNLANALYCRGEMGDDIVLGFLNRIEYQAFLDARYVTESTWALARFVHSIGTEHSAAILATTAREAFFNRYLAEAQLAWESRTASDLSGFIALIGAMYCVGLELPAPPPPLRAELVIDVLRFLGAPSQLVDDEGALLTTAGLRCLCST